MNKRQQKQTLNRLVGNYEMLWRHWTAGTRCIELQKINQFADDYNLELDGDFRILLKFHKFAERKL